MDDFIIDEELRYIKHPDVVYEETVERMRALGTYRPEYETEIRIYSEMVAQLNQAVEDWRNDGGAQYQVNNQGRVSKSPYIRAMEALRKDILLYSDRLGLNPRSMKSIEKEEPENTGRSLVDVLDRIAGNL